MENKPDLWVIIKITNDQLRAPIYKVLATWLGGYLDGDYWRLNSGIARVEEDEDNYMFYGYSGSCYVCNKNERAYGTNSFSRGVLDNMINKAKDAGVDLEELPSDTNWLEIEY